MISILFLNPNATISRDIISNQTTANQIMPNPFKMLICKVRACAEQTQDRPLNLIMCSADQVMRMCKVQRHLLSPVFHKMVQEKNMRTGLSTRHQGNWQKKGKSINWYHRFCLILILWILLWVFFYSSILFWFSNKYSVTRSYLLYV